MMRSDESRIERCDAGDAGFSPRRLSAFEAWLAETAGDRPYHLAVARHGRLVRDWLRGSDRSQPQPMASAAKSLYSSLLGIALAERRIPSIDTEVATIYPEMMDVGSNEGPKPGRYAFAKDRDITFRQLICNCSGYMKPDEMPGKVFHYQTFGMNVLTHALARAYGLPNTDAGRSLARGCGRLIEEKIRNPIGAAWTAGYHNFDLPATARVDVFGNQISIQATTEDMVRMGILWMNHGRWDDVQVVPEAYLREATVTNRFILENEPEENWMYGHGFWCNDYGKMWPDCPTASFAASGAGGRHIWVCPELGIVIVQNPGLSDQFRRDTAPQGATHRDTIARVLDALA